MIRELVVEKQSVPNSSFQVTYRLTDPILRR